MKRVLLGLMLLNAVPALADDPVRDLKKNPLNSKEWKAYRAAISLAKERRQTIRPECVNASFTRGTERVIVQFYYKGTDDEEVSCGDPHFSIEVKFDSDGEVSNLLVVDA